MAKETKVELEIPQGRQQFPMEQADTLLRMKFNGGWKLPENSEWGWTPEKGFEKKGKKESQPKESQPKESQPKSAASEE